MQSPGCDESDPIDRLSVKVDVLCHTQRRNKAEFLKYHCDALAAGVCGIKESNGPVFQKDIAGIRREHAAEDIHQRAFTSSVFTDNRVHFSAPQIKIDVIDCSDSGIIFSDSPELEDVLAGHRYFILRTKNW